MANRYLGVDPMLTNVAIAYRNDAYVAEQLLPSFRVGKQSGKHFVYARERFRQNKTMRGAGANSNEVTLKLTTGNPFFCEDHALRQFVTDEDVSNAITPTSPFVDATENVTDMLMVDREIETAGMLTDTAVLTNNTTLSGTSQWSDYSNSDPFTDIETGKRTVHSSIFIEPNVLLLGKQVWDVLKHHPAFLERVKYSQRGVITKDLLAALVGVDRVIVAGAGKNTATEGQADAMGYIWGKHAVLGFVNPRLQPKMITLGFTYTWDNMKVERLRGTDEEDRKGAYVRAGDWYYDQKLVAAAAGYLIKDAIA